MRKPSPLTLELVEAMANNPASSPKLRKFHADQLKDLQRRSQRRPVRRPTAFTRFEIALENETNP
jgi:hypothetical protein